MLHLGRTLYEVVYHHQGQWVRAVGDCRRSGHSSFDLQQVIPFVVYVCKQGEDILFQYSVCHDQHSHPETSSSPPVGTHHTRIIEEYQNNGHGCPLSVSK
uniref:Predicted protein n=1 Tax=Hordeum vulgare subsp. vulgare TaxID=112509 RepID=F2D2S9_HORVV|nr:predicted protein [Hordeum vulgare subsp. vulgare]